MEKLVSKAPIWNIFTSIQIKQIENKYDSYLARWLPLGYLWGRIVVGRERKPVAMLFSNLMGKN